MGHPPNVASLGGWAFSPIERQQPNCKTDDRVYEPTDKGDVCMFDPPHGIARMREGFIERHHRTPNERDNERDESGFYKQTALD